MIRHSYILQMLLSENIQVIQKELALQGRSWLFACVYHHRCVIASFSGCPFLHALMTTTDFLSVKYLAKSLIASSTFAFKSSITSQRIIGEGVFSFLKGSLTSKVDIVMNGALGGHFELVLRQKKKKKSTKSKNRCGVPQTKKKKKKKGKQ